MMDTEKIILKYNYNERNFQALDDSDKNYQKEKPKGLQPTNCIIPVGVKVVNSSVFDPNQNVRYGFSFLFDRKKGGNARYLNMKLIR